VRQRPCPPTGQPGTLWVMMLCSKKYIYTPSVSRASNSSCADFGSNQLAIQLGVEYIVVTDDSCGPLAAMHQLPSGPLHIFLGALCDYASCEGKPLTPKQAIRLQ